MFRHDDHAGKYAEKRLSSRRDDRCDRSKLDADARLRGKVGTHRANEIIKAIDDLKSRRL